MMRRFTGATKAIISNVELIAHLYEIGRHFICELDCFDAGGTRRLNHFQAMLVGPGNQPDIASAQSVKAGNGVGSNRLIGMADVRTTVGIADRGGDIKGFRHVHLS